MKNNTKKRRYKKKSKTSINRISTNKLLLIFTGSVFVLFGIFIGDIHVNNIYLPAYGSICIGLVLQLITIAIFVKQKQNTNKPSHG